MTRTSKEGSQFDIISTKVIDLSSASEQPVKVVIETVTPTAATALDPQNKIRKGRFIVENVGSDSGSIASDAATPAIHNNSMGVENISSNGQQQREDPNNSTAIAPRNATESASSTTALLASVPLRSNASFTSVSTSSVSSHNVLLASSETSVAPEITKKGRFMVINTSANSTQQEVSTVPATVISISPALVAASTSTATSAAGSHRDQLVMQDVADRGNGFCTASSSSSFIPPKQLISPIPAAGAASTTAVGTVIPVVSKLDIAGIGMSTSHIPNTSASSSSSTVKTSSLAPLTPTNPSTTSSLATTTVDPGNRKTFNSIGKVYHFLDEIRQEVQEVDKLNRSLQNDMKFFRDKNKELEARNRELEKKLLEEKNLRETAEIKLAQMKKKMTEMKRTIAILSAAADPTIPESTATNNNCKDAKGEQPNMPLGGVDTTNPVEKQDNTNSPRNSPRRMFSSCENLKSIAVADEEDSSSNKTHRKTSSLFCPTSNGSDSRIRASSIGGGDANSPPPPSAAMKRGVATKTEKVFLRPPLPTSTTAATTKQRKESLESISSTFSDLSLMDNTMITSTKAGDSFECDSSRNNVESLANSNSKVTSKAPTGTISFDPMVANKALNNHVNDALLPCTVGIASANSTTTSNLLILEESSVSDGIRTVGDDSRPALSDPFIRVAPEEKDPFEEIFSGRRTTPF